MVEYVTWHGLGSIPAMQKEKKKNPQYALLPSLERQHQFFKQLASVAR